MLSEFNLDQERLLTVGQLSSVIDGEENAALARVTGKVRPWILQALRRQGFSWAEYDDNTVVVSADNKRNFGPSSPKVILASGDLQKFNPDNTVWFGGICLLYTGDSELIRKKKLNFSTFREFELWMQTWYPRIDQIHDTIGIPSAGCKKLVYIVEDSIWARRIAEWTGFDIGELTAFFKEIHEKQGKPAIKAWLQKFGWKGEISILYSSEIERELEILFRVFQRTQRQNITHSMHDHTKVTLLGTSVFLDIMGVKSGIIAIPFTYFTGRLNNHGFGKKDFYEIGFVPHWSYRGPTRLLPLSEVAHLENFTDLEFLADNRQWDGVNHCFNAEAPLTFDIASLNRHIRMELQKVYECSSIHTAG